MPQAALRPCPAPSCQALTHGGRCPDHQRTSWKGRGKTAERGYGAGWRKVRAAKLADNPLCQRCEERGRTTLATEVHHRDHDQFNRRPENLESVCTPCHRARERE